MTIEALVAAVPPPAEPFESFDGPWEPIEAALGTALPQDYKDFVAIYGAGYFMEFLGVSVPRSANPYVRLQSAVQATCSAFAEDEDLPYPMWPEPGGLLPFGSTDNGDYLFWLTRGPPDEWQVVVWDRGLGGFEIFNCGLTDFLAGLAAGDILPERFPADLTYCDELFIPHGPEPEEAAQPGVAVNLTWRMGALSGVSPCRARAHRRS